ncbi:hypothetical protein EFL95_00225 [Nocardioides marmorisolisilvae]|uniref:Uncharacterized protein n=2 Tax=Nocardioides marmorisolisilvae TaxID=1542737 RepID=A0A3N0DZ59_9ACTN|nr:hypothetical protein EFL95_00225 [Nocardioides marmorisolisilvae]
MLLLAGLGLSSPADAVGTGNPTISAPTPTAALYDGYTGPFVVDFDDAPVGTYDYVVLEVPAVGDPAPVTSVQHYDNNGTGLDPQLRVTALDPGSYRFQISDADTGTHAASVDFTVRSGSAPTCSLVVPTRVRVHAPLQKVTGKLNSTCAALHTATADWKVTRGGRTYDYFRFDGNASDTWSLYDGDPVGAYTVVPLSARSSDFTDVPQNKPTVVARRDSRLALGGSRSGSSVTLRTTLTVYSASTNVFRAWADKYVAVSYRTCSTCTWHHYRTLKTDAQGHASYRFTASSSREYRVDASGTSQAWEPIPKYKRL